MRNVFIDWGATKPHLVLLDEELLSQPMTSEDLLIKYSPFDAYLEAGCPHKFLYDLIAKGCEIYSCDTHDLTQLKRHNNEQKSDEKDVVLIRELWREQPERFHQLSTPQRKELQVNFIMSQYLRFMRDTVRFKLIQKSYEKEYGSSDSYVNMVASLEAQKKAMLNKLKPLLKEEVNRVKDIKGIGLRYVAGLLVTANPKRFPTLSKYLSYCGYKETSWQDGRGKFSRDAKCLAWQMSKSLILHKDPKFYPLYLKLKQDLREKHPDYSKAKIDGMAINRTSTFILKELYLRYSEAC